MRLAFTMAQGRGDTDVLLYRVAQHCQTRGLRLCGTVQTNRDRTDGARCDMNVLVLPGGPEILISQSLGKQARGCRLNSDALETAVGHTERALSEGADLLIVNKFGKQEADGRGFRMAIADALAQDVPVLLGANKLNRNALLDFVGGEVEELEPNLPDLLAWVAANVEIPQFAIQG